MVEASKTSLFDTRRDHFAEEKRFLAKKFGKFLIARLQQLCRDDKRVILFIDSGTTLLPFFEVFNDYVKKEPDEDWVKNFVVVTNNLAGVSWLSGFGAYNSINELALNCVLLPGKLLPKYRAVTGYEETFRPTFNSVLKDLETENQINSILKKKADVKNVQILALLTGNWIRIRKHTKPALPIPLAKGRGHLIAKKSIIKCADEVFVVSPLGKIFSNQTKRDVLILLKEYSEAYEELDTESSNLNIFNADNRPKIKLITTYRPETGFILSNSSIAVFESLTETNSIDPQSNIPDVIIVKEDSFNQNERDFSYNPISKLPHYMFHFKNVSADETHQLRQEFPHSYSHKSEFLKYFHISEEESSRWLAKITVL